MKRELTDLLIAYLAGWKTVLDINEWLAGVDWNDPAIGPENQGILGNLELLATEVIEGLRGEFEFASEVAKLVAESTNIVYGIQFTLLHNKCADSSNDSIVLGPDINVLQEQRKPVWNISPRPVLG